ncbi:Aldo/keto reductase [Gymnopus androsaceus JB14]|uniref:Aldo/keto reductase n=1 Tax=Gymnopus androsaceus JB14 TaxID=1447944 RepID=A0A6A4H779_9AGAR|nr:Aldo/keto reductase [Gymnopus androsaceus JB14]
MPPLIDLFRPHVHLPTCASSPTKLGVLRVLSPNAGVHVSPFCLGAMSIGETWFLWIKNQVLHKLLDAQDETSEQFIGEWMEKRGIRDQIVVATKYTSNSNLKKPTNARSMHISVEASLKKLRTSYIDRGIIVLPMYVQQVKEAMDSFHTLVMQGKDLYLGISDTPPWVVAQANEYARDAGKTPFVVWLWPRGLFSERKFRTDTEEQRRKESEENGRTVLGDWHRSEAEVKVSRALEKVTGETILLLRNDEYFRYLVAIAYVMYKTPYVFPIIGGRKIEHLEKNMQALAIVLTEEQIKFLESAVPFDKGFPYTPVWRGSENTLINNG